MGKAANGHAMQVGGIPAFRQSTPKCLFFGQSDKIGPALEAREAVLKGGATLASPSVCRAMLVAKVGGD